MTQPAFVQGTFQLNGTAAGTGSCTFGSTVKAGNLLRVSCNWNVTNSASSYTCTDTAGNKYNMTYFGGGLDNTNDGDMLSFHCGNCISVANNQVTITCSGTASTSNIAVWEVSGILPINNPVRAAANNQAIVGGAAVTVPNVNIVTCPGDWVDTGNNADNSAGSTSGPGWTLGISVNNGAGGFYQVIQYQIANSNLSSALTATADDTWNIIGSSFIPAVSNVALRASLRPRGV